MKKKFILRNSSLVKEFPEQNPIDSGTVLQTKLRSQHHIHYDMFDRNQMFKQKKPSTPGYISQPVTTVSLRHLQKHPGVGRLSTPGCVKKTLIEKKAHERWRHRPRNQPKPR